MSKVLVVDDLPSELELIAQYLASAGYEVTKASNGKEALEKVMTDKPDAIVADWMMPEMGGLDLCRQLKKNPETANIPVIACTAKDREVDKMWAMKQGVKAYIVKPCSKEELVNAVRQALGG
ncbi:MAG: response regulator [Geminocystis sp.]|nr:response regulator [Geminocystis sp.]HIK37036.1 response regulator [Geminocystis sp. M7585_C2015_104]MCS7147284.1 response regulator [Geminocystis sp.]MCX8078832.1 response regulator [Geminocystis sp.]MDW8116283.1 response regulator [Geminocystis sp.]